MSGGSADFHRNHRCAHLGVKPHNLDEVLGEYVEEKPTLKRHLESTTIGRLSALIERAEAMVGTIRELGLDTPLGRAQAVRALMRVKELVRELEEMLGLYTKP